MAANTTMVHVRVDEKIKAPNATSSVAIAEANEIIKSRRARFATADALLNDLEAS